MGKYINPTMESKEKFLHSNGERISEEEFLRHNFNSEKLACVLVENGVYTAAIICFCENELQYVKDMTPTDPRPSMHYLVEKSKLEEYL